MKMKILGLAFVLLAPVACNGMFRGSGSASSIPPTALRVDNQRFADMTVYAARLGERVRLGLAAGHSNTVFTVPRGLIGGLTTLRFIADPIGGAAPSVSEQVTISPGDSIVLTIPPI